MTAILIRLSFGHSRSKTGTLELRNVVKVVILHDEGTANIEDHAERMLARSAGALAKTQEV